MLTPVTPLRKLLDIRLDGLDDFVTARRNVGKSWRVIANDIRDLTGIDVAHETLRSWYDDADNRATA